jgi:hypothetical protein
MSHPDYPYQEKETRYATNIRESKAGDDVFGAEEGHQIQYKTLSWQVRSLLIFFLSNARPHLTTYSSLLC